MNDGKSENDGHTNFKAAVERDQFEQLFEQAPTFMALLRGPEHRFELVNPRYRRLIGERTVEGKTVAEALPEAAEQGYVALLDEVYRSGKSYTATAARYAMQSVPGGPYDERYLDFVYQPIRDNAGAVSGIFVQGIDITEREHDDTRRRALLNLTDRWLDTVEPDEIAFSAAELLGSTLKVSRAGYGTVDLASETITIERDWNAPGVTSLAGVLQFRDYGSYIEDLKRGETVVFADAEKDPRTAATADALKAISAQSVVNMPVSEQGGLVALLYLNHATSRDWSADELAFIWEVAARTRIAVERARTAMQLRASEARLLVLNADLEAQVVQRTRELGRTWAISPDILGILNFEGYFERSNPAWQTLLGLSEQEVRTTKFFDFIHPDDLPRTYAAWDEANRGKPALRFENRYRHKDGGWHWLSWVAVPEGDKVYCSARDITTEKEQALALARSTAERDRLWETTTDLMGTAGIDGFLKAINPAWTRLLGWSETELLNTGFAEIVDPLDHLEMADVVNRLAAGKTVTDFVDHVLHKDGSWRTIMWAAIPEPGSGLFYIVGRDITDQRRFEDQLRQSQKMEAVGQLTGGIAHDFNNMLAVLGSLDLLERRLGEGDARTRRYVAAATDGAKRAAVLTQRLLAFSRQQPLKPEAIDANRLVAGMSDLLRHSLGPAVELEAVLAGGLWRASADPNQLENAILNLAVNARDAMADGGRLTIETQNAHLDDRYAALHLGVPAGQYVLLAVTDTGIGMPADVIAKAFDPFFTTKEVGKGTGLGLSQVYGFVRQSGGHVKIYSEPGEGTTVKVYLPRLPGAAGDASDDATPLNMPFGEPQEVVLVVEDEPAVRQFSIDALEELGYRVLEADSAAAALRLLDIHPEIALLFTDVIMPRVNGAKLAEEARKRRPELKVLFTTGYTRNAVVHNGTLDPGVELIGKPFTVEELAAKVREILDQPAKK